MDDGFNVAAHGGAFSGRGSGRFGDGDDAAIGPCLGRDGAHGLIEIGQTDLHLLPSCSGGAKQGSRSSGIGVRVREDDAKRDGVGIDNEEWILPFAGIMDIDVEAFGREWNLIELGALLVALGGGRLGLVLGSFRVFGNSRDGLLFFVTGDERQGQEKRRGQNCAVARAKNHEIKDSRANESSRMREGR
jgi:hypothetical protein